MDILKKIQKIKRQSGYDDQNLLLGHLPSTSCWQKYFVHFLYDLCHGASPLCFSFLLCMPSNFVAKKRLLLYNINKLNQTKDKYSKRGNYFD